MGRTAITINEILNTDVSPDKSIITGEFITQFKFLGILYKQIEFKIEKNPDEYKLNEHHIHLFTSDHIEHVYSHEAIEDLTYQGDEKVLDLLDRIKQIEYTHLERNQNQKESEKSINREPKDN